MLACFSSLCDLRASVIFRGAAAPAVLLAREFHARTAVMLVHSFGTRSSLLDDFDAFGRAVSATKITPDVLAVPSVNEPRLFIAWCDGDRRFLQCELPSIVQMSASGYEHDVDA